MYTPDQIEDWKKKAEKWDALDEKIASLYPDEDDGYRDGADLERIDELAAIAFGCP